LRSQATKRRSRLTTPITFTDGADTVGGLQSAKDQ
jgi:hypothetical protein